ncbi:ribulose-phosphate 3-epimerase [Clostridium sp. CAG:762]|nr:ribulose-phosphate 3-epimerase [Clostridium sp. CAG:762]
MKLSISLLSIKNRLEFIKKINDYDIDYIHIDVMDNTFTNNVAYSIEEINEINKISNKKLDIHLMVNDPIKYINSFNNMNIEYIIFHVEIDKDINNLINTVHGMGYKCGLAINPNTNIDVLEQYINNIDLILVMSVMPGYGGQLFINSIYNKLEFLRNKYKNITISVDGGINQDNIYKLSSLVDMVVIGSYLSTETKEKIDMIKNIK